MRYGCAGACVVMVQTLYVAALVAIYGAPLVALILWAMRGAPMSESLGHIGQ